MASNSNQWLASVTADIDGLKQEIDDTLYLFGMKVISRLSLLSPVDTGHFRRNWQVSINSAATKEIDGFDPTGLMVDLEAEFVLSKIGEAYQPRIIWFTNNVDYAYDLEMGYSRKAPQGMVGITKPLLPYMLQEAAAEAKRLNAR